MLVSITIDMDSSTAAERYAEIRRLLILADLLARGTQPSWCDDLVANALRGPAVPPPHAEPAPATTAR